MRQRATKFKPQDLAYAVDPPDESEGMDLIPQAPMRLSKVPGDSNYDFLIHEETCGLWATE
jgi:hypothetical protein